MQKIEELQNCEVKDKPEERKHKNAVLKYRIFYSLTFSIVIVDVGFVQEP